MRLTPFQTQQLTTFKALSDGTRLRMISALHRPMTVKQLADLIGEDHHKLYHHMRVLEKAGIVKLVETRTDSHIVEKYYQLLENAMVLNTQEFSSEYLPMFNSMVLDIAQTTLNDLIECSRHNKERASASRMVLRCQPDQFAQLRGMVQRYIREIVSEAQTMEDETGGSAYEMLILHFPVVEAASAEEIEQHGSAVKRRKKVEPLGHA